MSSLRWSPCVVGLAGTLVAGLLGSTYVALRDPVPPAPPSPDVRDFPWGVKLAEAEVYPRLAVAKDAVARELVAERITLLEAAEQFRALNAERPDGGRRALLDFHGSSEREKLCRQVIRWTCEVVLEQTPSRVEAVRARLEEELERHLEQGTIDLPRVE